MTTPATAAPSSVPLAADLPGIMAQVDEWHEHLRFRSRDPYLADSLDTHRIAWGEVRATSPATITDANDYQVVTLPDARENGTRGPRRAPGNGTRLSRS
jgi:hypothetical protein